MQPYPSQIDRINEIKKNISLLHDEHMSCWYAVKQVIGHEIANPADVGFLMATMSTLAKQQPGEDPGTNPYEVEATVKEWVGIWNCLNVCLNNELYKNRGQQTMMLGSLSKLAEAIEEVKKAEMPPLEIVKFEGDDAKE